MSNTTRGYYLVFEHVRGINGALNPQIRETFKALTKTLYSEKKKKQCKDRTGATGQCGVGRGLPVPPLRCFVHHSVLTN